MTPVYTEHRRLEQVVLLTSDEELVFTSSIASLEVPAREWGSGPCVVRDPTWTTADVRIISRTDHVAVSFGHQSSIGIDHIFNITTDYTCVS